MDELLIDRTIIDPIMDSKKLNAWIDELPSTMEAIFHFVVGMISYLIGLGLLHWFIIHISFELLRNTKTGINFVNKHMPFLNKKKKPNSPEKTIHNQVLSVGGWFMASAL